MQVLSSGICYRLAGLTAYSVFTAGEHPESPTGLNSEQCHQKGNRQLFLPSCSSHLFGLLPSRQGYDNKDSTQPVKIQIYEG